MNLTFGERLKAARKGAGYKSQQALADDLGVSDRLVRMWETDERLPPPDKLLRLRTLVGEFDAAGDPVEVAVRQSPLVEWRQDETISHYKRHLYEQAREEAG